MYAHPGLDVFPLISTEFAFGKINIRMDLSSFHLKNFDVIFLEGISLGTWNSVSNLTCTSHKAS